MPLSKKAILLVDDEEHYLTLMHEWLSFQNAYIIRASNEKEVHRVLKTVQVDLIITDVHLGRANGILMADDIRESGYKGPFLIVSSQSELNLPLTQSFEFTAFLEKPFSKQEFLETVKSCLF